MEENQSVIKLRWKNAWGMASFRKQFLFTIVSLLLIAIFISDFFNYIQHRQGTTINDWLLRCFTPVNMSLYIFLLIYPVIILSVIQFSFDPPLLLKVLQAYVLLLVLRIATLYFVSLEPSPVIIPLEDPFIGYFFYGNTAITKDLFFSGHLSTMFLLFLANPVRPIKYLVGLLSLLTAAFILMQHVHYTIDILAAPLFAWICFKMVRSIPVHMRKN
jgi:hypothetical protein